MLSLLTEWIEDATPEASVPALQGAHNAFASPDCWIPSPQRQVLELRSAAELVQNDVVVEVLSLDDMLSLVEEHGAAFAAGAATWVEFLADDPVAAFTLSKPFISDPPDEFLEGVSNYAARLRPRQRASLVIPAIEKALSLDPADEWFESAALERASQPEVAEALVRLFGEATNDDQRRLVLRIWALAAPKSKALERLIEAVFIPTAEHGAGGFDLALRYLELCDAAPSALRRDVVERLTAAAPDDKRKRRLRTKLERLGWLARQKSWLRRLLG